VTIQEPPGPPVEHPSLDQQLQVEEKSEGFLESAVGVITEPVPTLRRITATAPLGWAIWLTVALTAISSAAGSIQVGQEVSTTPGPQPFSLPSTPVLAVLGLVFGPILGLIGLAIGTGILKLTSLMFGGKGSYRGLFCGLAFASIPNIFSAPVQVLQLFGGLGGQVFGGLISVGLTIWVVVLAVIAVRENNSFSTGRAVGAVLLPIGVIFLLIIVIVVVVITAAVQQGGFGT
jgi:hypothetical protein